VDRHDDALRHLTGTLRVLFHRHEFPARFKARSAADAIAAIADLLSFLHVVPTPARTVEGWLDLLRVHPVIGGAVFDLQLAAAMLANGVQRIYTFNAGDFEAFPELIVIVPGASSQQSSNGK
jgi:predicted nucleic acid-binding protein